MHLNDNITQEKTARLGGATGGLAARTYTSPAACTIATVSTCTLAAHTRTGATARTDATACTSETVGALRYPTCTCAATWCPHCLLGEQALMLNELVCGEEGGVNRQEVGLRRSVLVVPFIIILTAKDIPVIVSAVIQPEDY
jgi:hypothetical protein